MRKIATLEVVVPDNPLESLREGFSSLGWSDRPEDKGKFRIVLNRPFDIASDPVTGKETASIFAHELGHFVTQVMKSVDADIPSNHPDRERVYQMEKHAWEIGKMIYPKLDPKIEEQSLNTYKEPKELDPIDMFIRIIRIMGGWRGR